MHSEPGGRRRTWIFRSLIGLGLVFVLLVALFVIEGTSGDWRTPIVTRTGGAAGDARPGSLRVAALNVAKCDVHAGGWSFASVEEVTSRLDRIATCLGAEPFDVVLLSEVVFECGPVPVDQVDYLARKAGFGWYASGENYRFGLPFFRMRTGNAILSRRTLRPVETQALSGDRPFWNPTNRRRALWCEMEMGEGWLLVGSVRNDSFDLANNSVQVDQLLRFAEGRPALIGGDFNAPPHSESMEKLRASQRFVLPTDSMPTFPASSPNRRIDEIFGPAAWRVVHSAVFDTGVSDHLGVATTFEVR